MNVSNVLKKQSFLSAFILSHIVARSSESSGEHNLREMQDAPKVIIRTPIRVELVPENFANQDFETLSKKAASYQHPFNLCWICGMATFSTMKLR